MAVPNWPSSLPYDVQESGYMEGEGDGRLRTQMEVGPAKVRRRGNPPRPLRMRIWLTGAQLSTLRNFVNDDLAGGVLPFNFASPRDVGVWLLRFADALPSWTSIGPDLYEVSLELEILP